MANSDNEITETAFKNYYVKVGNDGEGAEGGEDDAIDTFAICDHNGDEVIRWREFKNCRAIPKLFGIL